MSSSTHDSNKVDTVSNEDLMVMLKTFKVQFLYPNKDLQDKQHQDLNIDLLRVPN